MNKACMILVCGYIAVVLFLISLMVSSIVPNNIENNENITEQIHEPIIIDIEPVKTIEETGEVEETTMIEEETTVIEYQQWWTNEELDMLAAVIFYEAGSNDCSDRHQQLVAQVVLNRVIDDRFPDTIYDVITQQNPVQYSTYKLVLNNMGNRDIIPQRCYDNALAVLNNDVDCPSDIVWQAGFIQGEIYEVYYTTYSTTYFCHR